MSMGWLIRALKVSLWASLLLLLILILGIGLLVGTSAGINLGLDLLQEQLGDKLHIGEVSGDIAGPLEISDVSYQDGDLVLSIAKCRLDWRPRDLLHARLHLLEVSLAGARLQLPAATNADMEKPAADNGQGFAGLRLPIDIEIDKLEVEDFAYQSAIENPSGQGPQPLRLDKLLVIARTVNDQIDIERFELAALSANVRLNGWLRLRENLPLSVDLQWSYPLPDTRLQTGKGHIEGDLEQLRVQQELASPLAAKADVILSDLLGELKLSGDLELLGVELQTLVEGYPARLEGRLHTEGTPDRLTAEGGAQLHDPNLGLLDLQFLTRFQEGVIQADQLRLQTANGGVIDGKGNYVLNGNESSDVELTWRDLAWPFTDKGVYLSPQGDLHVQGRLNEYQYTLGMQAILPDVPPAQLNATGQGNLHEIGFTLITLGFSQGKLQGQGRASLSPEPSWQLVLQGEGLDPAIFKKEFPGLLDLDISTEGRVSQGVPKVQAELRRLKGRLRGLPLEASGAVKLEDNDLTIDAFKLSSSTSQLETSGHLGKTYDLDWKIKSPDLGDLWPGLTGHLDAEGRLQGDIEQPKVQMFANGGGIAYGENAIEALDLHALVGMGQQGPWDVDLGVKQLRTGNLRWEEGQLNISGRQARHHLKLQLRDKQSPQMKVDLDAGLQDDWVWSGTLRHLELEQKAAGQWRLDKPVDFTAGAKMQRLQPFCLHSGGAGICGQFSGQEEDTRQGELKVAKLPLGMFQSWMPTESLIHGHSDIALRFMQDKEGKIQAEAKLSLPSATLEMELPDGSSTLDISGGELIALIDQHGASGRLNLPLSGLGSVQGEVALPGLDLRSVDAESQITNGHLQAQMSNLSPIGALSHNLQNVRGRIQADLTLSGTLGHPKVRGGADLEDAALDIPELGLELRELVLKLTAADLDSLTIQGGVTSGKGRLNITGDAKLSKAEGFPTELKIQGRDVVAINVPEAEAEISPNVSIKIDADRTDVNGEITIPYARIQPREIPKSAASNSPDLVIVGEEETDKNGKNKRFYSNLRIILGDRVNFTGMGLRAKLSGNLLLIEEPGRPVIGRGRIGVTEGTYNAYGQDLKIERGYALFADNPVDNPGLDVRAIREAGDVTAGVKVTGTLKKPEIEVFSIPAKSQTEALSYLLTGRAPGESGEKTNLNAALVASGAGELTSEIGRQLGLEEFRVEAGASLSDASVVAGTYLSPKLYVQYVNELATKQSKVRLRYDLSKKWQIQTESGDTQAVDIFYTIEK